MEREITVKPRCSTPLNPNVPTPKKSVPDDIKKCPQTNKNELGEIDEELIYLDEHPDEVEGWEYFNLAKHRKKIIADKLEFFERRIEDILNVIGAELDFFQENPEYIVVDEYNALTLLRSKYLSKERFQSG